MSSNEQSRITRRDVVTSGLAGAALTGAAMVAQPTPTSAAVPKTWDHEADVVCVGYGGAGASTAVTCVKPSGNGSQRFFFFW